MGIEKYVAIISEYMIKGKIFGKNSILQVIDWRESAFNGEDIQNYTHV